MHLEGWPRSVMSSNKLIRHNNCCYLSHNNLPIYQGKGVYQFANKYGANVDGYR
jgi:hypothetical protein